MISKDKVYWLCNKHEWFTHGSIEQYDKMFSLIDRLNKNGESTLGDEYRDLVTVIWLCSDDSWARQEIADKLTEAFIAED